MLQCSAAVQRPRLGSAPRCAPSQLTSHSSRWLPPGGPCLLPAASCPLLAPRTRQLCCSWWFFANIHPYKVSWLHPIFGVWKDCSLVENYKCMEKLETNPSFKGKKILICRPHSPEIRCGERKLCCSARSHAWVNVQSKLPAGHFGAINAFSEMRSDLYTERDKIG